MDVKNREAFRKLLVEELPEIVAAHPEVVLAAMAKNPEALRANLAKVGIIVGEGAAKGSTDAVMSAYREGQIGGEIPVGFGARVRRACAPFAHRVRDGVTGRLRTTYLDHNAEDLANAWFRAFMNGKSGGQFIDNKVDSAFAGAYVPSGKSIHDLSTELNRMAATRAPNTPMTIEQGTGGGFLLPQLVAAEVFEYMQERFLLRGMVEVFVSAAPLSIPNRQSLIQVFRQGAGKDLTEVNIAATLGDVKLSPELVGALTYIDPRLALAAAVGPVRWVIGQLAEAMAKDYQRTIVAGLPQNREPLGILNLIPSATPAWNQCQLMNSYSNASNQSKRDGIRTGYYAVAQPHRESDRFVWIASNAVVQTMNSVNDLNMQPFQDAKDGQPAKYMGKVVVETSALTGGTVQTLLGGDMGQYAWLESPDGLALQQTDVGGQAWTSNTIGVKIVQSVDGAPVIPNAFVQIPSVS